MSLVLRWLSHSLVWFYAVLLAAPLYYLISASFKDNNQIFLRPFHLPQREIFVTRPGNYREFEPLGFQNYSEAWGNVFLGQALINSFVVTVGALIVTLALCIPASYALARSSGRVVRAMERYFSVGLLIPGFAALVPAVLLAIELGLFQTRLFLVLAYPAGALPLSIILLTQFMRTIPRELEESAVVDGAGQFDILWRIYVPLARPGIATVTILNVLGFWNEFLYALVITGINRNVRTIQVAIPNLVVQGTTEFGVLAAGTVISIIPVYVMYVLMQRRMESALTEGAVKG
ncbi:MAG: carbohydrate ABC transporter permease [Actinomycetota bacterium]